MMTPLEWAFVIVSMSAFMEFCLLVAWWSQIKRPDAQRAGMEMNVFSELNQANNRNGDLLTEISRLQAENAKLRAELEQVESENEHHIRLAFVDAGANPARTWKEAVQSDAWREVLEPFAKAADKLEKCRDDRPLWAALDAGWAQREAIPLTVGDLRRARAALME